MSGATFTYVAGYALRSDGLAVASVERRILADNLADARELAELGCGKVARNTPGWELVMVRPAARGDRQPHLLVTGACWEKYLR